MFDVRFFFFFPFSSFIGEKNNPCILVFPWFDFVVALHSRVIKKTTDPKNVGERSFYLCGDLYLTFHGAGASVGEIVLRQSHPYQTL